MRILNKRLRLMYVICKLLCIHNCIRRAIRVLLCIWTLDVTLNRSDTVTEKYCPIRKYLNNTLHLKLSYFKHFCLRHVCLHHQCFGGIKCFRFLSELLRRPEIEFSRLNTTTVSSPHPSPPDVMMMMMMMIVLC